MSSLRVLGHRVSIPVVVLSLLEAAAVAIAVYAALISEAVAPMDEAGQLSMSVISAVSVTVLMSALGLYQFNVRTTVKGIVVRTAIAFFAAFPLLLVIFLMVPREPPSIHASAISAVFAFLVVAGIHAVFFMAADAGMLRRKVIILGGGKANRALSVLKRRADRRGFEVVGYVPLEHESVPEPALSAEQGLVKLVREMDVEEIVVSTDERRGRFPIDTLMDCHYAGIKIVEMIDFIEREAGRVRLDLLRPSWILFNGTKCNRYGESIKCVLDAIAAAVLLVVALPIMMATVVAIKCEDGWRSPVFYRQCRIGKDGLVFELFKFRSMRVDAEADGKPRYAATDDHRVTRVGRILRRARIDELPQLFNVLRGDMSMVGPRPERPEFVAQLERDIPFYRERHRIKPGITGWAQLLYPYGASHDDMRAKLEYDLYYLKNRSVLLDLTILLQTVEVVLFGKGAR